MNGYESVFINYWYNMVGSPVSYCNSFIYRNKCICMTSMVMLDITIEVSVNKELPLKGGPKLGLGTSPLLGI